MAKLAQMPGASAASGKRKRTGGTHVTASFSGGMAITRWFGTPSQPRQTYEKMSTREEELASLWRNHDPNLSTRLRGLIKEAYGPVFQVNVFLCTSLLLLLTMAIFFCAKGDIHARE